ncbi:hypothetical protein GUITHDRAFT_144323 [Guillardia theta CCMP2712]|uniref:CDP-diacylglycerol--inositol 3-phosphatidyltransferase n=1 Tax=Guillardia theta (strain CCMP2712) TaxID=905079 RepID=L1IQQ4_GUITC|nr:hypothetical protein GUITHDRAFT_144323 [Guillardia theta CCMP2712]EKX38402.1 hypothetical protein GUITHDRAFT_144323 [Guillardia theta CCMP2712]|eukprot:XP_005825382.1 hypothetical protein GUITHDRAFT_144323 [Guillardia theta CCMP2712]
MENIHLFVPNVIGHLYMNNYAFLFFVLLSLDLASHYCHVYSQLLAGTSSHKEVLFFLCLLNETFFVMCYLIHYEQQIKATLGWLFSGCNRIIEYDMKERRKQK